MKLFALVLVLLNVFKFSHGTACPLPEMFRMSLFSIASGRSTRTDITAGELNMNSAKVSLKGTCVDYGPIVSIDYALNILYDYFIYSIYNII